MLDMAILGLLRDGPMHGYELKHRLVDLGFWRISFGSVYPALRRLENGGLVEASSDTGRRKEYQITADGKEHFQSLVEDDSAAVDNSSAFRVRFAFLRHMQPDARIELLERRKSVLRERIATARRSLQTTANRIDEYTQALMEHSVRSAEVDVAWIDDLIGAERRVSAAQPAPAGATSQT